MSAAGILWVRTYAHRALCPTELGLLASSLQLAENLPLQTTRQGQSETSGYYHHQVVVSLIRSHGPALAGPSSPKNLPTNKIFLPQIRTPQRAYSTNHLSEYNACSATGLKPIAANHASACAFVTCKVGSFLCGPSSG